MTWTPRWRHVTQIHADGSGWNDCAEASLARAILEYDPAAAGRKDNPEWDLARRIHDPADPAGVWDLIDRLGVLGRGAHDHPGQGFTSADGVQAILEAFDLRVAANFVGDPAAAMAAIPAHGLLLCWVDGTELAPPSFPAGYFGGDWGYDHLILSLPTAHLFNDPLTVWPDSRTDVRYDDAALRAALGGVWILPEPEPVAPARWRILAACAGKTWPNHLGGGANPVVAQLAAGTLALRTGARTPHWAEIEVANQTMWVLADNLAPAP